MWFDSTLLHASNHFYVTQRTYYLKKMRAMRESHDHTTQHLQNGEELNNYGQRNKNHAKSTFYNNLSIFSSVPMSRLWLRFHQRTRRKLTIKKFRINDWVIMQIFHLWWLMRASTHFRLIKGSTICTILYVCESSIKLNETMNKFFKCWVRKFFMGNSL